MQAGRLNEFIEVWRADTVINDYGERVEDNFKVCSTRAYVRNMSGGRTTENSEIVYTNSFEFNVRIYVPVQEQDEIRWQNGKYRILNLQKRREYNDILIQAEKINE